MNRFDFLGKVGEGSFASVYKAKRKEDGLIYAVKKIKISNATSKEIANCLNQVRILASIHSPYIIAYKEALYDEESGCLLLVTQFAPNGDLSKLIKEHIKCKKRIPQQTIWKLAIQMLFGLRALHKLNIFHRDIKGANVLLTSKEEVKLGDLNVSKISKSGMASTQTGTPYYASPEVWSDYPYNGKCDIWSMGCVLYEMASFRPPFTAQDLSGLKKKIHTGVYDRIPTIYSAELQSFIGLCLHVDPKVRPSADKLLHLPPILKRICLFPDSKFNQESFQSDVDKENRLIRTIRVPNPFNFGQDLKTRLPKSNYQNSSQVLSRGQRSERNRSVLLTSRRSTEERLPELGGRYSSKEKPRINIPRPRLVHLR